MTKELLWLTMTALLATSLWIPFVVGINTTKTTGPDTDPFSRPPDPRLMPAWVHRSYRAHLNMLEQFLPFAVIVLIGHVLKVSTPVTQWCAVVFFWLRVAHAIGMMSGWARNPTRPIIFTAGWIVTLVYAWQVLSHA